MGGPGSGRRKGGVSGYKMKDRSAVQKRQGRSWKASLDKKGVNVNGTTKGFN